MHSQAVVHPSIESNENENSSIRTIAIVGFGPKGLYTFERLIAEMKAQQAEFPLEIHLFNRSSHFGSGEIYRTDQPGYLLMNFADENIDLWKRNATSPCVSNPLNYTSWLQQKKNIWPNGSRKKYSPRAMIGEYLEDGFQDILDHLPENISVKKHVTEVTDLHWSNNKIVVVTGTATLEKLPNFDHVILTTGHPISKRTSYKTVDMSCQTKKIDFIYPVTKKLEPINPKSIVGLKGMGLTFIDAVISLTEGRGGVFSKSDKNRLIYKPSGSEPKKIIPFSRSGLLMIPRSEAKDKELEMMYFNRHKIRDLQIHSTGSKVDFENELLPLIKQEIRYQYYLQLFREYGLNLIHDPEFELVNIEIKKNCIELGLDDSFGLDSLIKPYIDESRVDHHWMLDYLNFMISEADNGTIPSAYILAASVWRKIGREFNELYAFGGLTPESQRLFDQDYANHFNRIAHGPPLENMKKIQAVAEAGILDFGYAISPTISLNNKEQIVLKNNHNQQSVTLDYLVDARIPKYKIESSDQSLFSNLFNNSIIKPFENSDIIDSERNYMPGCLDINKLGHPINSIGEPLRNITCYGTLTEGITYDNDSLSRERNDFASPWAKYTVANWLQENKIQHGTY